MFVIVAGSAEELQFMINDIYVKRKKVGMEITYQKQKLLAMK